MDLYMKFYRIKELSSLLVCFAFIFRHMLTFIRYIEGFSTFGILNSVRYKEEFVISRLVISRFCSIHFTVRAEENRSLYQRLRYIEVR